MKHLPESLLLLILSYIFCDLKSITDISLVNKKLRNLALEYRKGLISKVVTDLLRSKLDIYPELVESYYQLTIPRSSFINCIHNESILLKLFIETLRTRKLYVYFKRFVNDLMKEKVSVTDEMKQLKLILLRMYERNVNESKNELDEMLDHFLEIKRKFLANHLNVSLEGEEFEMFFKPEWQVSDFNSIKHLRIWTLRSESEYKVNSVKVLRIVLEELGLPVCEHLPLMKKLFYGEVQRKLLILSLKGVICFTLCRLTRSMIDNIEAVDVYYTSLIAGILVFLIRGC